MDKNYGLKPGGIIFTSDWHCGLSLKGKSRDEEIERVLEDLTDKAIALAPKTIVVAGDLSESFRYPGSTPSKMIGNALYKMAEGIPGTRVFIIPGNHDWDGLDLIALSEKSNIYFIKRPSAIEVSEGKYMIAVPYMRKHNLGTKTYDDIIEELTSLLPDDALCFAAVHAAFEGTVPGINEPVVTNKALSDKVRKLFLGHIHMHKQVSQDVFYTGALIRNTFGEDNERSGIWHMDDNFNVTDIPLSGARRLTTLSFENTSEIMDGTLEEKLAELISEDPEIMVKIRVPGASAFSEQIAEVAKRVETEYSEPGKNIIVSDFALGKEERGQNIASEQICQNTDEDGTVKDIAEMISVKNLWSGYCREKFEAGGITEGELSAVEICGEALLTGADVAEIWESMRSGRLADISAMTDEKAAETEKEDEGKEQLPKRAPSHEELFSLTDDDLKEIEIDI